MILFKDLQTFVQQIILMILDERDTSPQTFLAAI